MTSSIHCDITDYGWAEQACLPAVFTQASCQHPEFPAEREQRLCGSNDSLRMANIVYLCTCTYVYQQPPVLQQLVWEKV